LQDFSFFLRTFRIIIISIGDGAAMYSELAISLLCAVFLVPTAALSSSYRQFTNFLPTAYHPQPPTPRKHFDLKVLLKKT